MGRKCNVLHCPSDSRRPEDQGVTFHKIPHHTDLRPRWLSLCKIPEERRNVKVIYVCSRHFLRADFCNFKGTKYMLKQGALPSVFPWTSNLSKNTDQEVSDHSEQNIDDNADELVSEVKVKSENKSEIEDEIASSDEKDAEVSDVLTAETNKTKPVNEECFKIKEEMFVNKEVKSEPSTTMLPQPVANESSGAINFVPGTRIEANDFHDKWYPAKIVEVDYDEKEVFVHFEKCPNRGDEWIPMDSSRLRPLQPPKTEGFDVGEKCLATWVDGKKFPATIKQIIDKGKCIINMFVLYILTFFIKSTGHFHSTCT